ncbi:TrbM/KikA/MpfK family conjugal transfer protein [Denitromonas sp.]|uniref:TrbM/KikA/MpfK family conjugal transfer protein n=1 Tax=Denitromonas sp. TaxID=2734609 RepID=UPI002AFE44F8|nr:TrbM/KikA/MpfK family conjugal transfer protein [Denitromonas sp.]
MITAAALVISNATTAVAQEVLEGDEKDACEAILCLSSGQPPHECEPALKRYFSIKKKKPKDTIKARRDFLEECPASSEEGMPSLINAIVNGAGHCDPETMIPQLNAYLWGGCEREGGFALLGGGCMADIPQVCKTYANHPLTRIDMPVKKKTCKPGSGYWSNQEYLQPGEFYEGGQLCKYEWGMP